MTPLHLHPWAVVGLVGASLLMVAGGLPERIQSRYRRVLLVVLLVGFAMSFAAGAALLRGGVR